MEIIYCLVSFALGWQLATWRKASNPLETPVAVDESVLALTAPDTHNQVDIEIEQELATEADDTQYWFFDGNYLDDECEHHAVDANATVQAQNYFLDMFADPQHSLSQRLEAIKAAISMKESLFDQQVQQLLCELANEADSSVNGVEITSILKMLEGKVTDHQLPLIGKHLGADNSLLREQALKTIADADHGHRYKHTIESMLNNDPKSEVRALAFAVLEQYYPQPSNNAA